MSKIDTLEPAFRKQIERLILAAADATGLKWVITSGRRTMAEQQELYDQGRFKPGKVVTNAKPGSSAHNFGLAADLAPLNPETGKIWWEAPKGKWRGMADAARKLGLVSGYYFNTIFDAPHVENPKWRDARAQWQAGEIKIA